MPVRILCTGDLHIGRQTSKTLSPWRTANAWHAIVDLAVREHVDLVAISGDLIDKDGKHYEAFGPIASGLAKLAAAGIETVAIAGNHDWDVLPRIARQPGMEHLQVIGLGGTWQRHTVMRGGQPLVHVDGWSFPAEHVRFNPVASYPAQPDDGVPVLGLLHAEVNVTAGEYAPVSLASLWGANPPFWLLGHIHSPQVFAGPGNLAALYPGSPYAMDPGEPGVHGAWLLTIDHGVFDPPQCVPLSPVQYVQRDLDVEDLATEDDFIAACHHVMTIAGQEAQELQPGGSLLEVSLRVHCSGSTSAHQSIERWAHRIRNAAEPLPVGAVTVNLDAITVTVTPPVNLVTLSSGNDPVAETARFLLALDEPDVPAPYNEVLRRTIASFETIAADANFAQLEPDTEIATKARVNLRTQGWKLLSALIATREQS